MHCFASAVRCSAAWAGAGGSWATAAWWGPLLAIRESRRRQGPAACTACSARHRSGRLSKVQESKEARAAPSPPRPAPLGRPAPPRRPVTPHLPQRDDDGMPRDAAVVHDFPLNSLHAFLPRRRNLHVLRGRVGGRMGSVWVAGGAFTPGQRVNLLTPLAALLLSAWRTSAAPARAPDLAPLEPLDGHQFARLIASEQLGLAKGARPQVLHLRAASV